MSLVEHELAQQGFDTARQHYRQAVDSFLDGRREASNGQLRSCLEDFILEFSAQLLNKATTDPKGAVQRLFDAKWIDGDELNFLKGLVGMSNSRGAHRGLTDEAEAVFRLHTTTAAIRYLIARLDPLT